MLSAHQWSCGTTGLSSFLAVTAPDPSFVPHNYGMVSKGLNIVCGEWVGDTVLV